MNSITKKAKQTLHFLCFISDTNILRKLFKKTWNDIQQPIDSGACGGNLSPSTSCILAELFFTCWRCTESHRKHMEISDFYCPSFTFALGWKFSISHTHNRHIWLLVITKTRLYNVDPLKPRFYIAKLGFTGVYIIFLISAQKHRLWVLLRTASPRQF